MKNTKNSKSVKCINLNATDAKILEAIRAARKANVNVLFKYNDGPPLSKVLLVDTENPDFIYEGIPIP